MKGDGNMQEKKPGKKSVAGGLIGIGFAILGVVFTAEIYSQAREFGLGYGPGPVPAVFGILFVSIAVYGAVKCFRGETDEEGNPAEKEAAVQPQGKAEKWTCAYCKTSVDGDSAFCPACGAGRKGKQ